MFSPPCACLSPRLSEFMPIVFVGLRADILALVTLDVQKEDLGKIWGRSGAHCTRTKPLDLKFLNLVALFSRFVMMRRQP